MEQVTINLYPIFKMIVILFAVVGGYSSFNNFMNLLARFGKDKLDNKKDMHAKDCDADIIQDLIAKNPIVVDNNIELFEHDKKLERIERRLELIEATVDAIRSTQRGGL